MQSNDHLSDDYSICMECGAPVAAGEKRCERCREPRVLPFWQDWVLAPIFAVIAGLILVKVSSSWSSYGWALIFGVPMIVGGAIGYLIQRTLAIKIVLGLLTLLCLTMTLITLELAGLLCGLILAMMMLAPALGGVVLGSMLRRQRVRSLRARYGEVLGIVLLGIGLLYLESLPQWNFPDEIVVTERIIAVDKSEIFDGLKFYEDIRARPPWLARIGLPRPLYTRGQIEAAGDVKVCIWEKGHLTKRIIRYDPPDELLFEVLEQNGIEDRSVELRTGFFRLESLGPGVTRVVVGTTYRPLLQARFFWRPFERSLAHVLHNHVLDGLERAVEHPEMLDPDALERMIP